MTSTSSPSTPGEPRRCLWCGHVHDLNADGPCGFGGCDCGSLLQDNRPAPGERPPVHTCGAINAPCEHPICAPAPGEGTAWTDADRDRVWPEGWIKCPLHPDQHGDVYHSANWHEDRPPASGEGTRQRPGGWVEGIGWVALLCDLAPGDVWAPHLPPAQPTHVVGMRHNGTMGASVPFSPSVVIITRWADGTTPAPPASPVPPTRPLILDDGEVTLTAEGDGYVLTVQINEAGDSVSHRLTAAEVAAFAAVPPTRPGADAVIRALIAACPSYGRGEGDTFHIEESAVVRMAREFLAVAPPTPTPCPYIVTGGEGTSYCSLAERSAMHAAAPPSTPAEQPQPDGLSAAELLADLTDRIERAMAELEKLAAPLGLCTERTRRLGKIAGLALVADWLRSYTPARPTDPTGSEA